MTSSRGGAGPTKSSSLQNLKSSDHAVIFPKISLWEGVGARCIFEKIESDVVALNRCEALNAEISSMAS